MLELINNTIDTIAKISQNARLNIQTIGSELMGTEADNLLDSVYDLYFNRNTTSLGCANSNDINQTVDSVAGINTDILTADIRVYYCYGLIDSVEFSKVLLLLLTKTGLDYAANTISNKSTYSLWLLGITLGESFVKQRPVMSDLIIKMLDKCIRELDKRTGKEPTTSLSVVTEGILPCTCGVAVSPADWFLTNLVISYNLTFKNPAKGYDGPSAYWEYLNGDDIGEVLGMHEFFRENTPEGEAKPAPIPAVYLTTSAVVIPGHYEQLFAQTELSIVSWDTNCMEPSEVETALLKKIPKGTMMITGEFQQHIAIRVMKFCEKYRIIFASVSADTAPDGSVYYTVVPEYDLKK